MQTQFGGIYSKGSPVVIWQVPRAQETYGLKSLPLTSDTDALELLPRIPVPFTVHVYQNDPQEVRLSAMVRDTREEIFRLCLRKNNYDELELFPSILNSGPVLRSLKRIARRPHTIDQSLHLFTFEKWVPKIRTWITGRGFGAAVVPEAPHGMPARIQGRSEYVNLQLLRRLVMGIPYVPCGLAEARTEVFRWLRENHSSALSNALPPPKKGALSYHKPNYIFTAWTIWTDLYRIEHPRNDAEVVTFEWLKAELHQAITEAPEKSWTLRSLSYRLRTRAGDDLYRQAMASLFTKAILVRELSRPDPFLRELPNRPRHFTSVRGGPSVEKEPVEPRTPEPEPAPEPNKTSPKQVPVFENLPHPIPETFMRQFVGRPVESFEMGLAEDFDGWRGQTPVYRVAQWFDEEGYLVDEVAIMFKSGEPRYRHIIEESDCKGVRLERVIPLDPPEKALGQAT